MAPTLPFVPFPFPFLFPRPVRNHSHTHESGPMSTSPVTKTMSITGSCQQLFALACTTIFPSRVIICWRRDWSQGNPYPPVSLSHRRFVSRQTYPRSPVDFSPGCRKFAPCLSAYPLVHQPTFHASYATNTLTHLAGLLFGIPAGPVASCFRFGASSATFTAHSRLQALV